MSPKTDTPRKITIIAEVTVYEKGNAFLTKVKIPAFYPPQHPYHHA